MSNRILMNRDKFRVTKPGCDFYSGNYHDFILHENMKNSMALMKGSFQNIPFSYVDNIQIAQGGGYLYTNYYSLTIWHNLGYVPFVVSTQAMYVDTSIIQFGVMSYTGPNADMNWYYSSFPTTYVIFSDQVG